MRKLPYISIEVFLHHLFLDGRWCCLSEVNDTRLILTDVMHQHHSTTV